MNKTLRAENIRSFAVFSMIIALSIGNILNFHSITLYKICSVLLPFFYVYFWLKTGRKFHWNIFFTLMGVFVLANLCMFGIFRNPHSIRQKLFFIARLGGHGAVIFLLYNFLHGIKTEQVNRYLAPILYVPSSINILVSIIQLVNDKLLPKNLYIYKTSFYVRVTGLFMDPNYNGFFISVCIFLLFYLYESSAISKKAFIILLIGNTAMLFFTLSFGSFIGFLLAVIILIFIRSNNKMRIVYGILVVMVIAAGIYAVFFIKDYQFEGKDISTLKYKIIDYTQRKLSPGSAGSRLDQYKVSINAFRKNPVFGIGTVGFLSSDNYSRYSEGLSLQYTMPRGWIIHSNLFAVLGENGLVGFIPYMGLVALGLLYSWRLYKRENRFLYLFGMQVALFFISNTINNLYFIFFWFILFLPFFFYYSIDKRVSVKSHLI